MRERFMLYILGGLLLAITASMVIASLVVQRAAAPELPAGGDVLIAPDSAAESRARRDLSTKLNVDINEIHTTSTKSVTWSDGSLGCPEEGKAYTQAIVPGYLVLLEYRGKTYEYHTDSAVVEHVDEVVAVDCTDNSRREQGIRAE